jgi:hypothetical protein
MNRRTFATLILTLTYTLFTAAQTTFPAIGTDDLPGAEFTGTRSFTQSSLYGYIDGGAELYLEYGFDTLVVTEVKAREKEIKVEVYRMKDPEAAFGIFSVSRFRCNGGAKLTDYYCRSAYQLQLCKGPFYVSIINSDGTKEEQAVSDDIARALLSAIDAPSFDPNQFSPEGVSAETMKSAVLVRGSLGVFNGVPSLSEILGDAAGYTALITKAENSTLISLKFDSEDGANSYIQSQGIDRAVLDTGGQAATKAGATASKICIQHLLLRTY